MMTTPRERSFELYLHDIRDLPLLTPDDEQRLIARVREGREAAARLASDAELLPRERPVLEHAVAAADAARAELTAAHLRLVVRLARQYTGRGVSLLDLIQEGNLALLQAAEHFEPQYGVRFATYAVWWIRHAIARTVAEGGHAFHIPDEVRRRVYRMFRARSDLLQQLEREPSEAELAHASGLSATEIRELSRYLAPVLSLETPLGEEGDDELLDVVPDPRAEIELSSPLRSALSDELSALLQRLTPEERTVLTLRFGLADEVLRSRQEVAERLGYSSEKVQRLEARALRKLRDPELLQRLREVME